MSTFTVLFTNNAKWDGPTIYVYFSITGCTVFKFTEFKPCLKSPKILFQLRAGFNLEKSNIILSGTNHI